MWVPFERIKTLAKPKVFPQTVRSPPVSIPTSEPELVADRNRWFTQDVHAHDSSLKAYLRGSFPTVRDLEDVVQESYLRIWKARAEQPILCARALLFRIARNLALNLLDRERASPVVAVKDLDSLTQVGDELTGAAAAARREELLLLAQAIDSLPARCREIVILRRIKNVPQKEIAARLGIAEATVEIQVVRGVKRCAHYLRRRGVRFDHETRP